MDFSVFVEAHPQRAAAVKHTSASRKIVFIFSQVAMIKKLPAGGTGIFPPRFRDFLEFEPHLDQPQIRRIVFFEDPVLVA